MRIRLKGINPVPKRLADGTRKTYWYAWKGGPRLRGEPGTPEFIASYNEAAARKVVTPQGKLLSVFQAFQASAEFAGLAERTRLDYVKQIKTIEKDFGDFPTSGLTDRRTRGIFMAWRDELAAELAAAGGLRVASVRPCAVVGTRSRTRAGESMCARWSALSWFARRQDLDRRRRGRLPRISASVSASAAVARPVDRPAAGRSAAPAVVGL